MTFTGRAGSNPVSRICIKRLTATRPTGRLKGGGNLPHVHPTLHSLEDAIGDLFFVQRELVVPLDSGSSNRIRSEHLSRSTLLSVVVTLAFTGIVSGSDQQFKAATANPKLRIEKLTVPQDRSKPLQIRFTLSANGEGSFAISQQQLSLHISTAEEPYVFISDLVFPKDSAKQFTVASKTPTTISASSASNRFGKRLGWNSLKPGKYKVRVYVNAGKEQKFDYQWLGQAYSDDFELVVE